MAIRTIEQGLEALAEKVKDCEKRLNQSSNQRRLSVVDQFGQEYIGSSTVDKKSATYIASISPDMVYLERFQFKVFMIDVVKPTQMDVYVGSIKITEYLEEQAHSINGKYMDDEGTVEEGIYPKMALDGDSVNGSFDLIGVANMMYEDGREDDAEEILKAGIKKIKLIANGEFTASILLYLKYSHINR